MDDFFFSSKMAKTHSLGNNTFFRGWFGQSLFADPMKRSEFPLDHQLAKAIQKIS